MVGSSEKQLVIVGLGNPGKKYELTRHNIGFITIEGFAKLFGLSLKDEPRFNAKVVKGQVGHVKVHLVMPQTYMNESGRSVRKYLDFYNLTAADLVVVVDDVAIPFGMLRLRESGSAGGHNGLKSMERTLGTKNFARLRMGIGSKKHPSQNLANHVLERFSKEEIASLPLFVERGVEVLQRMTKEELSLIMNAVNEKVTKEKKTDLLQGEQENNNDSKQA